MKKRIYFLFLPLLLLLNGCGSWEEEPIFQSGMYFDTVISITLYDKTKNQELAHCFDMAKKYETYFSAQKKGSDISKINAARGKTVKVHPETIELLQKGISYGKLSHGKFDITIGGLSRLWDYQSENPSIPPKTEIDQALKHIDYKKVIVNISNNTVNLNDPNASIDLGGIAKGFIADQMKAYLVSQGISSGVINLGGNILTLGSKENGKPYRIGIQKPFAEDGSSIAAVEIQDKTVVSSGIYERYFEQDGKIYHHILDTDTGYPYDNGLSSVTIICDSSADGDGLSTTCFALGLEKGLELVESLPDTEAVFISQDNQLHYSSGIGSKIPIEELNK